MLDVTGFAALIKRKRGEAKLTQETLALDVFGDSGRKADISRLENARVPNPQEATIQKICTALNISAAEMEPLRQSRPTAAQLNNIPSLSREELQNISARFAIDDCFTLPDAELRRLLTLKAEEYRALKSEVDAIPDTMKRLANLKAAAQDAMDRVDLEEVENLMAMVHEVELEEAAKSAEIRADVALLSGKVEDAYRYLSATADSFAAVDPIEPALKRLDYFNTLYSHGLRYGSTGMIHAARMIRDALEKLDKNAHPIYWSHAQNNLAAALKEQGTRTQGAKSAELLAQAVTAYHNALEVYTRTDHPVNWAMTQNNLAAALHSQASRTERAEGTELLAQAVTAYHKALEVYTRKDHPVNWGTAQMNLGVALNTQARRSEGTEAAELLTQAVTAYRKVLEVCTRTDHPVQWAMTQENLAIVQTTIATHDTCLDPRPPLIAALEAVDLALTVFEPVHMSFNHAKAIRQRDYIQAKLDALPPA